ncbi:MAG TPA: glycosyltransferase family 39 protein [Terriglobia bacterium]|nr:glycosyltransferase family 39 protein [Terriglobia bacterium]
MEPDEGIILQGTERILRGEVLYRDFFSYFTPGSYYLLALLFKVFGDSLLVARTALAVYGGLFSAFTYLMARRVCSLWAALAATYLVTITCLPWRFLVLHNWDSTLWACAAVYCATRFIEASGNAGLQPGIFTPTTDKTKCRPKERRYKIFQMHVGWAFAAGSFASLTFLFEQSKGAGLMLGLALAFMLVWIFARSSLRVGRPQLLALATGLAWPVALTFAYFASQHAMRELLTDWFWPLHNYSIANKVPYGHWDLSDETSELLFHSGPWLGRGLVLFSLSPSFLQPVLPIVAVILLAYWTLQARNGGLAPDRAAYYIATCTSLAGLLFSVVVVRPNIIHFVYLGPLTYLVLAWIMDGADIRGRLVNSIRPIVTIAVLIAFTAVGMAFLVANRGAHWTMETRRGRITADGPDAVLPYVLAHVPAGSKMLVYPYLPLYNYLTATYSPTRYEYLQPGMHTRQQEEEAIDEIEADRTDVVLIEPGFSEKIANAWPNTPLESVANDPVGDYILAHYHSCRILRSAPGWPFVYMVRKDLACP